MIFASDLDRTIIFSKRYPVHPFKMVDTVEHKNNKNISFMTKSSIQLIQEINLDVLFVPATARTIEEYKRVKTIYDLNLKFVILNNGGTIMIDGKEDEEWKSIVSNNIFYLPRSIKEFQKEVLHKEWMSYFKEVKLCDDIYWKLILKDEREGNKLFNILHKKIDTNRYNLYLTGKKMYVMPKEINKWNALLYLKNKLGINLVYAAGDSLMDIEMVRNANKGYIPSHAELVKYLSEKDNVWISNEEGMLAGEEILYDVWKEIKKEMLTFS